MLRTLCRCSVATTNTMSQSFSFDKVLFFGREGEEALNYYRLTPEEIKSKKVLEVPGGPGTFTAHARSLGAYVTAADPCYALSLPAQQELAMTDLKAFLMEMDKPEATNIVRSVDWWGDMWYTHTATIDRFLTDQEAHPDSYVGAALPRLPFEDDSFDYVLSSHLLFSYSPCEDGGIKQKDGDGDDLDLTWHFHALDELMRVSRGDIRIFDVNSLDSDHLEKHEAKLHSYVTSLVPTLPPQWAAHIYRPYGTYHATGLKIDAALKGLHLYRVY